MSKYYAGIGSRQTPKDILEMMAKIGQKLRDDGYMLRSGGADGADTAFTMKINRKDAQIFLPWKDFNYCSSDYVGATPRAMEIAKQFHPAWERCSQGAKKLHGRNVHQVLGYEIEPSSYSEFVICWTPNAEIVGGTATAIKIAQSVGIPVYNLANKEHYDRLLKYIS